MVEINFEGAKIQVGHRVKIPKVVVDTLKLKTGQKITIKFDLTKKEIIIKESNKKSKK